MKKMTKLIALTLAALMALTSCGGGENGGNNEQTGGEPRTDLVIGIVNEPTALEPSTSAYDAQSNARIVQNVYEGLLCVDDEGEIQPNVAETWEISEDRLTYTFHLRNDVKFHNGDTLTAEDVKYSFDKCIESGLCVEVTSSIVETIAQDDTTFIVKLSAPNAPIVLTDQEDLALVLPYHLKKAA